MPPITSSTAAGSSRSTLEYLARRSGEPCGIEEVERKLREIPERLLAIWQEADATGRSPDQVSDAMAQRLIGR